MVPEGPALILGEAPFSNAEALFLPPLNLADLRRSVHAFAPATPEMARIAERLHRETGGNPGLFVQLLRRYTQDGQVHLPEGPLELDPTAWLRDLDLDGLTVAGVLALSPEPLDESTLTEIAQVPADLVLPELEQRFLAVRSGERWALTAEALRAPLRAQLSDPEGLEERLAALGSKRRGPPPEDPLLEQATDLRNQGKLAEAQQLLEEGAAGSSRDFRAGRLLVLGSLAWHQGQASAAWLHYAGALGAAEHPVYRARAHIGVGVSALQVGHVEAALDHFEKARTEAVIAEDPRREAISLLNLAEARCWVGSLAQALVAARRAKILCEGLKDRRLECIALRHLGQVLLEVGLASEAGRTLADASALAKALDLHQERLAAHTLRARATLEERPGDRTAAAAALDRLSPLLSSPSPTLDPEGFWLLLQGVRAWASAVTGDMRSYNRARMEADTSKAGTRVTVRLRAELLLAEAERVNGENAAAAKRAESVSAEARMRGFRLLAWAADRLKARVEGRGLPLPGDLGVGLTVGELEGLSRR
jgi:tetratricopeptide (TPR) repeat protein